MVSIVPQDTPLDLAGKRFADTLGETLPGNLQQLSNRNLLQQSLEKVRGIADNPNASPMDLTLAVLQAGAGIPGSERYIGQILPQILQMAQARRSQQIGHPGEALASGAAPRDRSPVEPPTQRQQAPNFLNQQQTQQDGRFFPSNIGGNEQPGNLPQAETSGQVRKVYATDELLPAAIEFAKESTRLGIPLTIPEAYKQFKEINEENKLYNQSVASDLAKRVASQEESGTRSAQELLKVFPEATSEQQAIFQKKGEARRGEFKSEGDFNRAIAKDAVKFKNMIASVKQSATAPRTQNALQRKFMGTEREFKDASKDLKVMLKPLLDEGLYDTARNLLEEIGYYPEERESILNPITDRVDSVLRNVPTVKTKTIPYRGPNAQFMPGVEEINDPNALKYAKEAIKDAFKVDSNISPVLLRRELEKKGYDWRVFKDAWNDLVSNEEIKLNDDQTNLQNGYLASPPLSTLGKILHGLNLIGR